MRPNPRPLNLNIVSPRGLMWMVIVLLVAVAAATSGCKIVAASNQ